MFRAEDQHSCNRNVTSVIYLAALSDYNSSIIEDRTSNGMTESLILWQSIVNSNCECAEDVLGSWKSSKLRCLLDP